MAKLIYAMIILLLVLATPGTAKPSCETVSKRLAPCLSYIQGRYHSIKPSGRCCRGLIDISNMMKNHGDYTSVCKCIKNALLHTDYDPKRFHTGSQQCNTGYTLPPVGHTTTC
ncbi:hypothetical protein R3W88_002606 [Solanum pinnatisectum]|uniref:Bifunctional inhibitor/plant lipid transfer protein/seed storage helical domain-containing protein n=1 Tax=Solanum pinnatisectum TaxID=50273 RepID=A0AAV9MLN5_9SOLN|nr:hypothetical protein R3W88_002606 [Solanum pinnatisectum]